MSESPAKRERRKFKRIPISVTIRYAPRQIGSDVPADLLEGRAVNISQSGAALELPHRLRRKGHVELIFMQSEASGCVSVVGKVVRTVQIPGVSIRDTDGRSRPLFLVAVEFTRTLEIRELAMLRDSRQLDDTEIQGKRKS